MKGHHVGWYSAFCEWPAPPLLEKVEMYPPRLPARDELGNGAILAERQWPRFLLGRRY